MKCFNLPGFNDHFQLNLFMIRLYREHKDWFLDDVKISSIFGNFHFCPWDGGRNFPSYNQCTKEEVIATRDAYNDYGIPLRLVFTNPVLEEKHLHNRFCNMILKELDNGMNEVCVNSPLMENYIRENYPSYKIISSTTKRLTKEADILKELENDNYYQICFDYDVNKNMKLLESIPKEKRDKFEFLSNAICHPGCPIRKQHYAWTGPAQLTFLRDKYDMMHKCTITEGICHPDILGKGNNLSNEDIDKYHKMGYKYFKLEGRTMPSGVMLSSYLYYLIKPECYFEVIAKACEIEGIFVNDSNGFFRGEVSAPRYYHVSKGD